MTDETIIGTGATGICRVVVSEHGPLQACQKTLIPNKNGITLKNEISIMKLFAHTNIPTFYEGTETEFRMLLCQGKTLRYYINHLREVGLLYPGENHWKDYCIWCVYIFSQLLDVLNIFRKKRVIHRDLKPENIIISEGGHVYVCDYGLAVRLTPFDEYMNDKQICGTPRYFAPEIFLRKEYSYKTDSYALGLILYEMLTLYSPYKGESYTSLQREVMSWAPKFSHGFIPKKQNEIELKLVVFIQNMTHASRTKRYDVENLAKDRDLKKFLSKYVTEHNKQLIGEFGEHIIKFTPPIKVIIPPPAYKELPPPKTIEEEPFIGNVNETVIYTPHE
jgi:serine/threonine protein kinase